MLRSKEPVHPKLLAKVFKQICEENNTGVLQIITKKVEVLSFDIKDGKISNIKYKTKRNKEALKEIGAMEEGKYTFYERKEIGELDVNLDMPTNDEVLQYLLGQSADSSPDSDTNTKYDNHQSIDPKKTLTDETMAQLKKTLTDHIGPVSNIVCKKVFTETENVNTAISMLEKEIPDADRAQRFKEETQHLLVTD